jgi:hypothetical protein
MLVDAITVHMLLDPHIVLIPLSILYVLSYIQYVYYIIYNIYSTL